MNAGMNGARRLVAWLRKPTTKQKLLLLMATEGMAAFYRSICWRLDELEDKAKLGRDLRALEDVVTLADLERLQGQFDDLRAQVAPDAAQESPEAP
jgi:hypothetical protein